MSSQSVPCEAPATVMRTGSRRLLMAALVVGLGFRLAAGLVPRMNLDEAWHFYLVQQPINQWWAMLAKDRHPPLYDLYLSGLVRLTHSEVLLRLPMIVTAVLTLVLVFLVGRELFGPEVGAGATAFYAVTFLAWEYDTWLRDQGWLNALALLSTWLLLRLLKRGRPRDVAAYGLSLGLLVADHYLGFMVLACHVIYALWRRPWAPRVLVGVVVALVLYSPCIPLQLRQIRIRSQDITGPGSPGLALQTTLELAGQETGLGRLVGLVRTHQGRQLLPRLPLAVLFTVGVGLMLIPGLLSLSDAKHFRLFMLLLCLPPVILIAGIALRAPELYRPRYYTIILPYFGMALAAAARHARRWVRWGTLALAVLILVVNLAVVTDYVRTGYFRYMDWQPLARWVARRQGDAALVALSPSDPLFALAYYYAGDGLVYRTKDIWDTHIEYREGFLRDGGIPLYRVRNVADLRARLRGINQLIVVFWMSHPDPVRTYLTRNFGVLDAMRIQNYQPDGRAEAYLLRRRNRPTGAKHTGHGGA